MDVFISYSHHDADVARTVASHLEARGHSPFIDYLGIRGGQEFADVIGQAIDASDAVVVLLSGDGIESHASLSEKSSCEAHYCRAATPRNRQVLKDNA